MGSYREFLGNSGYGYQANTEGNGFFCSSAVNQNKLIKKIAQENRDIHKRLETAMSKSSSLIFHLNEKSRLLILFTGNIQISKHNIT